MKRWAALGLVLLLLTGCTPSAVEDGSTPSEERGTDAVSISADGGSMDSAPPSSAPSTEEILENLASLPADSPTYYRQIAYLLAQSSMDCVDLCQELGVVYELGEEMVHSKLLDHFVAAYESGMPARFMVMKFGCASATLLVFDYTGGQTYTYTAYSGFGSIEDDGGAETVTCRGIVAGPVQYQFMLADQAVSQVVSRVPQNAARSKQLARYDLETEECLWEDDPVDLPADRIPVEEAAKLVIGLNSRRQWESLSWTERPEDFRLSSIERLDGQLCYGLYFETKMDNGASVNGSYTVAMDGSRVYIYPQTDAQWIVEWDRDNQLILPPNPNGSPALPPGLSQQQAAQLLHQSRQMFSTPGVSQAELSRFFEAQGYFRGPEDLPLLEAWVHAYEAGKPAQLVFLEILEPIPCLSVATVTGEQIYSVTRFNGASGLFLHTIPCQGLVDGPQRTALLPIENGRWQTALYKIPHNGWEAQEISAPADAIPQASAIAALLERYGCLEEFWGQEAHRPNAADLTISRCIRLDGVPCYEIVTAAGREPYRHVALSTDGSKLYECEAAFGQWLLIDDQADRLILPNQP